MRSGALFLSMIILGWAGQSTFAAVQAYDGFDYPNDIDPHVPTLNGGTGWAGAWIGSGLGGVGFTVSQTETSMGVASFPFTAVGDHVIASGAGGATNSMRVQRQLASPLDLNVDGVSYASFMFQKSGDATATSSNNMEFSLTTSTSANGTIRFGSTSTNQFFVNDSSTVPAAQNFGAITLGSTYFVVLKLQSFAASNDIVSALVYDGSETVPASEPATWDKTKSFVGTTIVDYARFWIGTNATGEYDEVRIGQTWGDVTNNAISLLGDFNSDGKVDAGDFTTWRKNDSTNNPLENDNGLGTPIGVGHYNLWRANFGSGVPGSGSVLHAASNVPEPASIAIVAWLCVGVSLGRRR